MIEIYPNLFIGVADDYEFQVKGNLIGSQSTPVKNPIIAASWDTGPMERQKIILNI